jgi:competence protein ComGF
VKNQEGYTLLHALFTLSIFLVVASSIPAVLTGFSMIERKLDPSIDYEWNLFIHQFRLEFRGAEDIGVTNSSITFTKNGEEILYEKYGNHLRRRVNKKGHEIVLGPLDELELHSVRNGVEILMGAEGESQTGRFFTYGQ